MQDLKRLAELQQWVDEMNAMVEEDFELFPCEICGKIFPHFKLIDVGDETTKLVCEACDEAAGERGEDYG